LKRGPGSEAKTTLLAERDRARAGRPNGAVHGIERAAAAGTFGKKFYRVRDVLEQLPGDAKSAGTQRTGLIVLAVRRADFHQAMKS